MKRILISTVFTLAIITLYQFVDINLFTIDFSRRVSSALFTKLRNDPGIDDEVVILDIGYVHLDTVKAQLELLESFEPKSIGVNLCNIKEKSELLDEYLRQNKRIITCDCSANSNSGTSRITTSHNEVTHFQTDKNTYFELQLSDKPNRLMERGNKKERINFRGKNRYYQVTLIELDSISLDVIKDKTVLVGFLRDSLITPMNYWYGMPGDKQGDMSDVQVSANIISTVNRDEFINDAGLLVRAIFILAVALACTGLIRILPKSNVFAIILGLVILIFLNALSSLVVVLAFSNNYYIELNEMTLVLIVSAIVGVYWNTKDRRKTSPQQNP